MEKVPMKKILLTILPLVVLSGCWRSSSWNESNQSRTQIAKKPDTKTVAFDNSQARFFDEDIEAFILEEDPATSGFESMLVAQNSASMADQLDWETPDMTDEFKTIYFGYDKANLTKDELSKLKEDIKLAKNLKDQTIVLKGKSCKKGKASEHYKFALSTNRAEKVAEEFEKAGISRNRLKVFGTGSTEAIVDPSHTIEETAPDRCVEIYTLTI
jgi:outer membrane protein OmpA-like peptidoglycan-associated protein